MGRRLLSLGIVLFLATPAAAAPISVAFRGVVGSSSNLALVLPGVAATDSVFIRFTYDDEAADSTIGSGQIGGPLVDLFPNRGIYPASGAPYGAEVEIGSYAFSGDAVVVNVTNDSADGDLLSFYSQVESNGLLLGYSVSLRDPDGLLISSDEILDLPTLQDFPGRRIFSVSGTGGQFVWGYHRDRVVLVPEPVLPWLMAWVGLVAAGRRGATPTAPGSSS